MKAKNKKRFISKYNALFKKGRVLYPSYKGMGLKYLGGSYQYPTFSGIPKKPSISNETYFRHKTDKSYVVRISGLRIHSVQVTTKKGKSRWLNNYEFNTNFELLESKVK